MRRQHGHPATPVASPAHPILAQYRAIEEICLGMLAAARSDDWPRVTELQASSRALIAEVRSAGERVSLKGCDHQERFRILRRILVIDGEIRKLAQPWQRSLDEMFAPRVPRAGSSAAHP